jgi:methionyl-tRNA formyltransferase
MRLAIIGQQAFGKAVLDAFLARGDVVAGVFVAPEPAGARPDPLRAAAEAAQVPVIVTERFGSTETMEALRRLHVDLAVMAYVVQFVPQSFCRVPRLGTIQFHPSLLPRHRGPSSINWPIILGEARTGLTIFRPVDALDEGPVILQKEVAIAPEDSVGSLYFNKIFPLGVTALLEATDLVAAGKAQERAQDEASASYEGWVREREAQINWAHHVDSVFNLIRGCDPAPGAWTMLGERRLHLFDARKVGARTFAAVKGLKLGQVTAVTPTSLTIHCQGGFVDVARCRVGEGKKVAAGEAGIVPGTILGDQ